MATYDSLKGVLSHKHKGSDISDITSYIGSPVGTFSTAYPSSPVEGVYLFTGTNGTVVSGTTYFTGDSALYKSSTWTRIPSTQNALSYNNWQPEYPGLVCDGVDDYISIAGNANLNFPGTPFMQEFFVKMPSDITTLQYLSYKSGGGFIIFLVAGSIYIVREGAPNWGSISVTQYVGKMLHITTGWDGTNRLIYLNGQLAQSAVQSTDLVIASATSQVIGGKVAGYFKGSIYLARFWNLALTASEVLQLYNNGQPQNSVILSKYRGASQVNKIANSSFTTDLTGWSTQGNHAITRITTDDATGTGACAEITATGAGAAGSEFVSFDTDGTTNGKRLIQFYAKSVSGNTTLNIYSNLVINSVTLTSTWQKFTFNVEYVVGSTSLVRFYLSGAGVFRLDDVIVQKLGTVLELKGENMGHVSAIDTSGNRLHGVMNGTPVLTVNPLQQKATTGIFTTNIASGTANKDIIIPAGYYVSGITVANTLVSGNLTNVQATLDPVSDNITLISGKTINNGKTFTFTSLADQTQSITNRTVRVNATGNGTGGMEVMLILARRD